MYEKAGAAQAAHAFAYEIKKDSAVVRRCFSRDTRAEIPEQIEGYPVSEIAPYAFSAHMEEKELREGIQKGTVRVYVPDHLRIGADRWEDTELAGVSNGAGGQGTAELPDIPQLCGTRLEQIVLPRTVRRVGRYCFYNCSSLGRISFHGSLADWGSGVFTGCHRVKELCVYTDDEGKSHLKDVLDELPEELAVEYFYPSADRQRQGDTPVQANSPDGNFCAEYDTARLIFPAFYEEGVENTPARLLETRVHGSGISYRNCFRGRMFDFAQYDALFPQAKVLERAEALAQMVMGRLQRPLGLSEKAKRQYEIYAQMHAAALGKWLLDRRDLDGVRYLLTLMESDGDVSGQAAGTSGQEGGSAVMLEKLLRCLIEYASGISYTEAVSHLMELRRKYGRKQRRRLEL